MLPEVVNMSWLYLFVVILVRAMVTKCPSDILTNSDLSAADKNEET